MGLAVPTREGGDDVVQVFVTPPGGIRTDISEVYQSTTWSGSYRQCARELKIDLAYDDDGRCIPRIDTTVGGIVEMEDDSETLFYGTLVTRQRATESNVLSLTCLDNGQFLSRNDEWYSFRSVTPEAATRTIAKDFGLEVGELAATGISITWKFPGVNLYRIIATLYTKAGEKNGKRYIVCFRGRKLCVIEKSDSASGLVIAPKSNLMYATVTDDISKIYTRVAIYSEAGQRLRVIDNEDSQRAYGVFQHIITQRTGQNAEAEAKAYLEDNDIGQTFKVDCIGDVRQISGNTVSVRDNSSGVVGQFWIDADTHTWKNGQYFTRLELNFRNLMDKVEAGKET